MSDHLHELSQKLGIATKYSAQGLRDFDVSDDVLKFFCKNFGYDASTDKKAAVSLQKIKDEPYKRVLESVFVVKQDKIEIDIYQESFDEDTILQIAPHKKKNFRNISFTKENEGERKWRVKILDSLKIGYYDLKIKTAQKEYQTLLAVCPEKCYTTREIESATLFGFAVQLYSLKSDRNWGIGDFTDLKNFADFCAHVGADVIGVNPLNALFHDFPENASPYSSISRLFLNPIYIDAEQTEGFTEDLKQKYKKEIAQVKKSNLIDYTNVYRLKINVLNEVFSKYQNNKAFEKFKKDKGKDLHLFALYQAVYHHQSQNVWGGWCAWPEGLKDASSMDMAIFEETHKDEIEFFKFLQFEADRQLKSVYEHIQKLKLTIGLYRDLPVGVCKDSAEVWSDPSAYIQSSGAGAPPDVFFTKGQKWCLGAFDPIELKKRGYEPFLKVLRANMAYAGALRIDHVMSLMRLFLIKDDGSEGTYISYPFEDMVSLVALESCLKKCAIVGESIGNVPSGFLEKLKEANIYSMSVLWAERFNGCGDFKPPSFYEEDAFTSVGTHDMTPLKMWWFGYEIELKYKLKLISEEERYNLYKCRENDRWLLLKLLDENGVWPQDNLRHGNYIYGEGYPEGLDEAVHKLLARSKSKVIMLQLEDILGVTELQNLPGTDRDKYPNWRHKLPAFLEDLENMIVLKRNIQAVTSERKK